MTDGDRSIIRLREDDVLSEKCNWILPILGLFHLQMNQLAMLVKAHWGDPRHLSSIRGINAILGRKKVTLKAADFWAMKDLIYDMLDAKVLALLVTEVGRGGNSLSRMF
jgi:hypothetical protein